MYLVTNDERAGKTVCDREREKEKDRDRIESSIFSSNLDQRHCISKFLSHCVCLCC